MEEIWKDIVNYPGYKISNFGRVKSFKNVKVKLLKFAEDKDGYLKVGLNFNLKRNTHTVHKLVAMAFLNHTPCGNSIVINHIDFNRKNNRLDNLEIITNRENTNKKHIKSKSKYVGVSWHKNVCKWVAYIEINKKRKHLGCFDLEYDAHVAYQKELNKHHAK